ncbi:MAG: 50S ribosomal protein L29 [Candidatus Harrisonbacteria bacterium]|nr:50S ribosomal protein L29 [Candidatus Harrisonbacteria bacterium]
MKHKEFEQLKTKPEAELQKNLKEYRERLWNLRNDLAGGKVKNVNDIQKTRKGIAQILTIINQHGK